MTAFRFIGLVAMTWVYSILTRKIIRATLESFGYTMALISMVAMLMIYGVGLIWVLR